MTLGSTFFLLLLGCIQLSVSEQDFVRQNFIDGSVEGLVEMFNLVTKDMDSWIEKKVINPDKINVVRPYFATYWDNYTNYIMTILLINFTKNGWSVKFVDETFHEVYVESYEGVHEKYRSKHIPTYCLYQNTELDNQTKYHTITPNGDDVSDYHFVDTSRYDENINDYPGQMITKYSDDPAADPTRCNETMTRKLLYITQVPESYRAAYAQYQKEKRTSYRLDELCGWDHDALQRRSNMFLYQFLSRFVSSSIITTLIYLDDIPSDLTLDHIETSITNFRCMGFDMRFIRSMTVRGGFSGLVTGAGVLCHVLDIDNKTERELNDIPNSHFILSMSKRLNVMLGNITGPDDEGYHLVNGLSYEYSYKSGESYLEGGMCFRKNVSFIILPV